ncbi:MAG: hypothetical protein C0593_01230 [Marinilabiliales bacterium]|nr:MAG: hypothetical protein C0593_01230 [Marinilabiliales bacterium]
MVNRIKTIMDREGVNASQLAEKLGIQRSTLSHILAGRNNPSLDVVYKILDAFPDISAEWLLKGGEDSVYKGESDSSPEPKSNPGKTANPDLFSVLDQRPTEILNSQQDKHVENPPEDIVSQTINDSEAQAYYGVKREEIRQSEVPEKETEVKTKVERPEIDRVITFYADGTFDVYYKR